MADASPTMPAPARPSWGQRTADAMRGLFHEAPPVDPANPPVPPSRWAVIGLNVAARAIVYGPFLALSALYCPLAVPALLASAGQPWTGDALTWASQKIQKAIPATKPIFDKISKLTGNKWWPAIGALAVATIPTPALLHVLAHHVPGFISSVVGSVDGIWTQALPFVLVTALPTATTFVEKVLDKLPILRDAAAIRRFTKAVKAGAIELGKDVAAPDDGTPAPAGPEASSPATPAAPAPGTPATPGDPHGPQMSAGGSKLPMFRALAITGRPMALPGLPVRTTGTHRTPAPQRTSPGFGIDL